MDKSTKYAFAITAILLFIAGMLVVAIKLAQIENVNVRLPFEATSSASEPVRGLNEPCGVPDKDSIAGSDKIFVGIDNADITWTEPISEALDLDFNDIADTVDIIDIDGSLDVYCDIAIYNEIGCMHLEKIDAEITAYCPCEKCCGKFADGVTASGYKINGPIKKFCAADPNIPFGRMIIIPGYGIAPVLDRGGAIKGNRIDVFFGIHQEALNWGRQKITVWVEQ